MATTLTDIAKEVFDALTEELTGVVKDLEITRAWTGGERWHGQSYDQHLCLRLSALCHHG